MGVDRIVGVITSRAGVAVLSAALTASAVGAFAAVAANDRARSPDRYYACVGTTGDDRGRVHARTIRLNDRPDDCPHDTDRVRAWHLQGPPGAGLPPDSNYAELHVHFDGNATERSIYSVGNGPFGSGIACVEDSESPSNNCGMIDVAGDTVVLRAGGNGGNKWLSWRGCDSITESVGCVRRLRPGINDVTAVVDRLDIAFDTTVTDDGTTTTAVSTFTNDADDPRDGSLEFRTSVQSSPAPTIEYSGTDSEPTISTSGNATTALWSHLVIAPGQALTVTTRFPSEGHCPALFLRSTARWSGVGTPMGYDFDYPDPDTC